MFFTWEKSVFVNTLVYVSKRVDGKMMVASKNPIPRYSQFQVLGVRNSAQKYGAKGSIIHPLIPFLS